MQRLYTSFSSFSQVCAHWGVKAPELPDPCGPVHPPRPTQRRRGETDARDGRTHVEATLWRARATRAAQDASEESEKERPTGLAWQTCQQPRRSEQRCSCPLLLSPGLWPISPTTMSPRRPLPARWCDQSTPAARTHKSFHRRLGHPRLRRPSTPRCLPASICRQRTSAAHLQWRTRLTTEQMGRRASLATALTRRATTAVAKSGPQQAAIWAEAACQVWR